MCRAAAGASGDLQPSSVGGKSSPPWAGAAGAAHPHCPASAAQGRYQQLGPSPVLPVPSWGGQRPRPLLCTSPSGVNHHVPASLPHPSLSSDPHTLTLLFGSPSRPLAPDAGAGTSLPEALLAPGDCPPIPAPQAVLEQGVHQDSTALRTVSRPHAEARILSDKDPGGLSLGHCQKHPVLPLPGWLPHPVPAARSPQEQQPRNLPGGKARLLPALLFPPGHHGPSAGVGCPGQPSLVPQHRHLDGLQNQRKCAQTSSSCRSSSCHSLRGSDCRCCLAAALPAAQQAARAGRCRPLAQSEWHGEKVGAAGQSWHRTSMARREGPQTVPKPQGPARLCAAARGLMGTPGAAGDTAAEPSALGPGGWAWDPAPQRDGECRQQRADGTSALSPPRGLGRDPAQRDTSCAALPVPSAQQRPWPDTSFALTWALRCFHADSTCVRQLLCPRSPRAWPQPPKIALPWHEPQRTWGSLSPELRVPSALHRAPFGRQDKAPAGSSGSHLPRPPRQLLPARS